jgi:DNA-binding NarL/FixJ family response regulator
MRRMIWKRNCTVGTRAFPKKVLLVWGQNAFFREEVSLNGSSKGDAAARAVRVFLLVGNRLLRDTLLRLFRKPPDVSIVGQGSPSTTPCGDVQRSNCDVILTDPIPAAPPVLAEDSVAPTVPNAGVLLVGMDDDDEKFLSAVRAGSSGYLLKDASAADVISAVRSVFRGEAVCPPRLCPCLFKWAADEARDPARGSDSRPSLTIRQQQLDSLVARGLTNKEIASELCLSEFTVKNHLHRIMKQVDAESRHEAVESARTHGYLAQQ